VRGTRLRLHPGAVLIAWLAAYTLVPAGLLAVILLLSFRARWPAFRDAAPVLQAAAVLGILLVILGVLLAAS
jgi:hypothetical protein